MKKFDITKCTKDELIKLKVDIDLHISELARKEREEKLNSTTKFEKLSEIGHRGGTIFCVNFGLNKIHNMDFVNIKLYESKDSWTKFSSEHETKPLGCSSSLPNDDLEDHCFLSPFYHQFYFFTLKPERWDLDLIEKKRLFEFRRVKYFNSELETDLDIIGSLLKSSDEINNFIKEHQNN